MKDKAETLPGSSTLPINISIPYNRCEALPHSRTFPAATRLSSPKSSCRELQLYTPGMLLATKKYRCIRLAHLAFITGLFAGGTVLLF
jgi:hypothetical protein